MRGDALEASWGVSEVEAVMDSIGERDVNGEDFSPWFDGLLVVVVQYVSLLDSL